MLLRDRLSLVQVFPLGSISRAIEINLPEMPGHQPLPSPVEPGGGQYML
ncbi:hypothetical protein [Chitinophaga cymbidii]|nr:hypothetical protein [Chitinophaga cymbidii]